MQIDNVFVDGKSVLHLLIDQGVDFGFVLDGVCDTQMWRGSLLGWWGEG